MPIILLENIRSAFNVGSIFRVADATGSDHIALVGYTPRPVDRMGRVNAKVVKTSLGAERSVPWSHVPATRDALARYPDHLPVAVEQTSRAIPYTRFSPNTSRLILLFGNETDGLLPDTRALAPDHIFIPMLGQKESLNVSVCAAVILYRLLSLSGISD